MITNLKEGVGDPWAGQANLSGLPDLCESLCKSPSLENLGADPPIGSKRTNCCINEMYLNDGGVGGSLSRACEYRNYRGMSNNNVKFKKTTTDHSSFILFQTYL